MARFWNIFGWLRRKDGRQPGVAQATRLSPSLAQPPKLVARSPTDVFTPTRPRSGQRTLVGRQAELARIHDAVLEENAHVVLYSERGRGKTSLSNLAIDALRRSGAIVARCACEAESTYDTIIHALARDLPHSLLTAQTIDPDAEGCEGVLPNRSLRPGDVAAIMQSLSCPLVIFVVDEFDRVADADTRTRLADTIKLLSDRGIRLYFLVVGVSDTLEQIIGQHPSIQRNISGIHLPLLSDDEIVSMMIKGGAQAGVAFPAEATRLVAGVARGMPYMAQLLGLRIAQSALRGGAEEVRSPDLASAVSRLLDDAASGTVSTYVTLNAVPTEPDAAAVLLRLARAEQDQWGRMTVVKTPGQMVVGGRRVGIALWAKLLELGVVVQPDGETGLAQFRDRLLVYHVLLLAARAQLAAGDSAGSTAVSDAAVSDASVASPPRLHSVVSGT